MTDKPLPQARPSFVYQRKDSTGWIVRYKDDAGKWRDHRCPPEVRTKRQAEIYARAWIGEMDRLGHRPEAPIEPPKDRGPTVDAVADKWLPLRDRDKELAPSTLEADKGNLKKHIRPKLGKVHVRELSPRLIRAFIRELKEKKAASTVRNIAITLSVMLKDCEAEEWAGEDFRNPMKHEGVVRELPSKLPRPERVGVIVHLTPDQAERLIVCPKVPEVRRVRYLLAFTSGSRAGEMSALTWQDLVLDEGEETARITKSIRNTKVGRTKTRSSIRTIPIQSQAAKSLRAWKAKGWVEYVGRHPQPTDPVFPGERGETIGASRHSARQMRADLVAAECPTTYAGLDIDFHACRRSFSTWLDANGVSETIVKRIMGHAPQGVTQRHYTAGNLEAMRRAVETIKLNLTTGEVVALPMRKVANGPDEGGEPEPQDEGRRDGQVANHVAECDVAATCANVNRLVLQGNQPVNMGGGAGNRTRVRRLVLRASYAHSRCLVSLGSRPPTGPPQASRSWTFAFASKQP